MKHKPGVRDLRQAIAEHIAVYDSPPSYSYLADTFGVSISDVINLFKKHKLTLNPKEYLDDVAQLNSFPDEPEEDCHLEEYYLGEDRSIEAANRNVHYSNDTHEFFRFSGHKFPIALDKETWADIVRSYSNYGPLGKGENQVANIARIYDLPANTLRKMLRAAGVVHESTPFTKDELMTESVDDLSDRALEYTEHQIVSSLEAKKINKAVKEAGDFRERLYDRKVAIKEMTEDFMEVAKDMPSVSYTPAKPKDGLIYHAPLADLHAGLHVWGKELWANDYGIDVSSQRMKDHAAKACDWIASQNDCSEVYVSDVGDTFHGLLNQTEGGTILQQDTRGKKVWRETCEAKIEAINTFLEVAPTVKVIATPGNHDGFHNFVFYESLAMYFRNDERVEFLTNEKPQSYFIIEGTSTMHLLMHGTKMGQLTAPKAKATVEVVARQSAGRDYDGIKKVKAYMGHLHNAQTENQGAHLELIRLPAACETDDYAQGLGFFHDPGARVFQLDENGDIGCEKRLKF